MKSEDGSFRLIVLETGNLEELKKGRPAKAPDGSVLICWTPDPVWLADRIMGTNGDTAAIAALIEEAAKRPQRTTARPYHKPFERKFDRENSGG